MLEHEVCDRLVRSTDLLFPLSHQFLCKLEFVQCMHMRDCVMSSNDRASFVSLSFYSVHIFAYKPGFCEK